MQCDCDLQVKQWKQATKWLLLWLILSCLTVLHSAALVSAVSKTMFAAICVAMFSWSGLLGSCCALRALLCQCMSGCKDPLEAVNGYGLKVRLILFQWGQCYQITQFSTACLLAASLLFYPGLKYHSAWPAMTPTFIAIKEHWLT